MKCIVLNMARLSRKRSISEIRWLAQGHFATLLHGFLPPRFLATRSVGVYGTILVGSQGIALLRSSVLARRVCSRPGPLTRRDFFGILMGPSRTPPHPKS